jgi:molybdopterin converting factor subunit 1
MQITLKNILKHSLYCKERLIMSNTKHINVKYFASFREQAGTSSDHLETTATYAKDIYQEIAEKHSFSLKFDQIRVAINDNFADDHHKIQDGDTLVFIPPVAGG